MNDIRLAQINRQFQNIKVLDARTLRIQNVETAQ